MNERYPCPSCGLLVRANKNGVLRSHLRLFSPSQCPGGIVTELGVRFNAAHSPAIESEKETEE